MYYVHPCSYCNKVFYVYRTDKMQAAEALYQGIKSHLIEWGEDDREYEFDDYPEKEINQMYYSMKEMNDPPHGAYEIR